MEGKENDTIASDECDPTEHIPKNLLIDLVAQLTGDKESDHVVWNDEVVFQRYEVVSMDYMAAGAGINCDGMLHKQGGYCLSSWLLLAYLARCFQTSSDSKSLGMTL